jgi:hypothetical protein
MPTLPEHLMTVVFSPITRLIPTFVINVVINVVHTTL